jgi:hypothetical protein
MAHEVDTTSKVEVKEARRTLEESRRRNILPEADGEALTSVLRQRMRRAMSDAAPGQCDEVDAT